MSVDYRLTLAGDLTLEEVAALAAPGATEGRSPAGNRVLSASLNKESGYVVSIVATVDGYYEAESDGGEMWQWEPARSVDITFHMDKEVLAEKGRPHMLRTVDQVLRSRPEDAALILNGGWLMLTRVNGQVLLHNAAEWHDPNYDIDGMRTAE
ncbi:SitI3 family protein [Micromonospora sp. SH-82]|uniref:SitI3 family protein n=1 Tax=Micromonospora sp. SH-82 TaxID=3132938 RepID=UPI003EC0AD71